MFFNLWIFGGAVVLINSLKGPSYQLSMDLETENRLAALLMEEARRLSREADKEGVHAYLQKPNVRGRPNSRFLSATVRGVEQANRAAEISEMWRAREKELELDTKKRYKTKETPADMHSRNGFLNGDCRSRHEGKSHGSRSLNKGHIINSLYGSSHSRHENDIRDSAIHSSYSKCYSEDSRSSGYTGIGDEEIEEFLHSRVKRGRGSVGCRMDEPGPYLPSTSADHGWIDSPATSFGEEWKCRVLGPEKPHFLKSSQPHDGIGDAKNQVTHKRSRSDKDHGKEKKKSKEEKSKKRRKEKRSKHHKKNWTSGSG